MWTMHEYINADKPDEDRSYGSIEMFGDEVVHFIQTNKNLTIHRPEYGYIILFEDLGDKRHCWSFRHHAPIMGIDDVPESVTEREV